MIITITTFAVIIPFILFQRASACFTGSKGPAIMVGLSLLIIAVCITMKLGWPVGYVISIQEDGPIENAEFFFYFMAAAVSFYMIRLLLSRERYVFGVLYYALSVMLIMVAMEEISWTQRVFNFRTPAVMLAHNTQQETTLHNLTSFQDLLDYAYIIAGMYGVMGAALYSRVRKKYRDMAELLIPDKKYFFYFLPIAAIYLYIRFISVLLVEYTGNAMFTVQDDRFIIWRDQEPAELLFSMGMFLFVCERCYRFRRPGGKPTRL